MANKITKQIESIIKDTVDETNAVYNAHEHYLALRIPKSDGSRVVDKDEFFQHSEHHTGEKLATEQDHNNLTLDNMNYYPASTENSTREVYSRVINQDVKQALAEKGADVSTFEAALKSGWRIYLEKLKQKTITFPNSSEFVINQFTVDQWIEMASQVAFASQWPVLSQKQEKGLCHILFHLGQVSRFLINGPFTIGGPSVAERYIAKIAASPFNKEQKKAIFTVSFGETKGSPYYIRHQQWKDYRVTSLDSIVEQTWFLSERQKPSSDAIPTPDFALAAGLIQWTGVRAVKLCKAGIGTIFFGLDLETQYNLLMKDVSSLAKSSGTWGKVWNSQSTNFDGYFDAFFRHSVFGTGRDAAYNRERAARLANKDKKDFKPYFEKLDSMV